MTRFTRGFARTARQHTFAVPCCILSESASSRVCPPPSSLHPQAPWISTSVLPAMGALVTCLGLYYRKSRTEQSRDKDVYVAFSESPSPDLALYAATAENPRAARPSGTGQTAPHRPPLICGTTTHLARHGTSSALAHSPLEEATDPTTRSEAAPPFKWSEQWYPVLPLVYLEDGDPTAPRPITILGRDFVVWRSGGAPEGHAEAEWSVFEDVCPHRRAPLSTGKVVGCHLMCRYHGWEFDGAGRCVKLPMSPPAGGADPSSPAFRAKPLPVRAAGGLLWVYLGDAPAPPDIPAEALLSPEEAPHAFWSVAVSTVSFMSLVENVFDPAHAPYIHEGQRGPDGVTYAPENTRPMAAYALDRPMDRRGFTLTHTPYLRGGAPGARTTRQFVPPVTQRTVSPSFRGTLHFVPVNPRETRLLVAFPLPKWVARLPRAPLLTDPLHLFFVLSDGSRRFFLQDLVTMQGQDERKMAAARGDLRSVTRDLTPTPSDFGVATFQRWVRTYAGGGPFSDPAAVVRRGSLACPPPLSPWDSHCKDCPACRRALRGMAALETAAGLGAWAALAVSAATAVHAASDTAAATFLPRALVVPFLALVGAIGLRWLGGWARRVQERAFYAAGPEQLRLEVYRS